MKLLQHSLDAEPSGEEYRNVPSIHYMRTQCRDHKKPPSCPYPMFLYCGCFRVATTGLCCCCCSVEAHYSPVWRSGKRLAARQNHLRLRCHQHHNQHQHHLPHSGAAATIPVAPAERSPMVSLYHEHTIHVLWGNKLFSSSIQQGDRPTNMLRTWP